MSSLINYNDPRTDKFTSHSYLELYDALLNSKKDTATHVLEVGIGNICKYNGGSIKMWYDYFQNAKVYALEINNLDYICDDIKELDRVKLFTSVNAYDEKVVNQHLQPLNIKFDMILDDGDHELRSMISFIQLYCPLLKEDGVLIIEDIPKWEWIDILTMNVPEQYKSYIETYDLRNIKNRFDDIVFVVNKAKKLN